MQNRYPPINAKFPHMLHGGDYNPDQWLDAPAILDEDVRLMKLAGCNAMSVGIFSWSQLEPEEGRFTFDWLDRVMDSLADAGVGVLLATPGGACPAWLGLKNPETRRLNREGRRAQVGWRHDHCPSSPVYRSKCAEINERLARRYAKHPALLAWHVNNEYGGECCCELCMEAFRQWAARRFDGDIEALDLAWWTAFWGRRVTDFNQIANPQVRPVDWRRFVTDQTIDFFLAEIAPLRRFTPEVPVTTNFMGLYPMLDYTRFAQHVDFVSWDSYPHWHRPDVADVQVACGTAFVHDLNRCLKGGRPFVLMESQPQIAKGAGVLPLKRPGLHMASSLQAVAHGSDSVMYFQWRKGRGGQEKFHGAVVDHAGHEHTRAFREVAEVGRALARLDGVVGTTISAEVALLHDWDTRWALESDSYLGDAMHQYTQTCIEHYRPFWARGVPVDVISQSAPLDRYKLVVAPLLYMLRPGTDERLAEFVDRGGTLVVTYGCGMVDEHDRAILGGWPGGKLRGVLGVWHEETDGLYPGRVNPVEMVARNDLGLAGRYDARDVCAVLHAESAKVLATYTGDFYAGSPALTVNRRGKGHAYYVGGRMSDEFLQPFYDSLARRLELNRALDADPPTGVSAQTRTDGKRRFLFLLNFTSREQAVRLDEADFFDMLEGRPLGGNSVKLPPYGSMILERR